MKNNSLPQLAFFVCASVVALAGLDASAQAQTVAWYQFQGGAVNSPATGTGTILDSSGNGLNGTPFLSPTYVSVPGYANTDGLRFTGGNQRVFVADSPQFALTQSLTLEALIQFNGTASGTQSASQIMFRGDDRVFLDPYSLFVGIDGKLGFDIENASGGSAIVASPLTIPVGQYISVAGTLNNSTNLMSLYINGLLVATTTTTIRPFASLDPSETPGFGIGNVESANYNEGFNGVIANARVSNVALQPGQFLNNGASAPEPASFVLLFGEIGIVTRRAYAKRRKEL